MLRKPADPALASSGHGVTSLADPWGQVGGWESRAPLRWRLSLTTGLVVAIAVAIMTLAAYGVVSALLMASADRDLEVQATSLLDSTGDTATPDDLLGRIEFLNQSSPQRYSLTLAHSSLSYGDALSVDDNFHSVGQGREMSVHTVGSERIVAVRGSDGVTVSIARDMESTQNLIHTLGTVLLTIASGGVVAAILAGMVVSKAGLRPITRLQRAADYVTQTNDLRPILVVGNDEIAQLTMSFNDMLDTLQESRVRQLQFVADAGHELKTPLTSMRTNIELLMMMNRSDAPAVLSEQDRKDLETDVLAQMSELSTLIGDLVDLAREDASEKKNERVELNEVIDASLERARRRRPDVDFKVRVEPWVLDGDQFSLERATLNLMDNAAKWSPAGGTVRVSMRQVGEHQMRLRVDDSGPGIPIEDREKVFERFYRSAEARSMPGSGLGLAIVRQIIERHDGTIKAMQSPDGGTRMEVLLPGRPGEGEVYVDPGLDGEEALSDRGAMFAQRWLNQE